MGNLILDEIESTPSPDDRVLVGVVNRKRDLLILRRDLWYRVPIGAAPLCVDTEFLAFYVSGRAGEGEGAIRYYAQRTGFELVRRRDLLPREANHPRANELYFKLQFRALKRKQPPITNPTRRTVSFIYTTWERFGLARTIADLYIRRTP